MLGKAINLPARRRRHRFTSRFMCCSDDDTLERTSSSHRSLSAPRTRRRRGLHRRLTRMAAIRLADDNDCAFLETHNWKMRPCSSSSAGRKADESGVDGSSANGPTNKADELSGDSSPRPPSHWSWSRSGCDRRATAARPSFVMVSPHRMSAGRHRRMT